MKRSRIDPSVFALRSRTLDMDASGRLVSNGQPNLERNLALALGAPAARSASSPSLATLVDRGIKTILDEGQATARCLLQEHFDQLVRMRLIQKDPLSRGISALNREKSTLRNSCQTRRGKEQAMDRVQGASQEIPAEMNMGRDFARGLALLWKGWFSILVQGEKSRRSQEQDYSIYIPRGTITHAGGKLLVAMRSAPRRVRGEAYCIGYIDASERSYGVYQIHMKAAFFSGKLAMSLLFVLDNNEFHEYGAWSAL